MTRYANLGGDSSIQSYEIGDNSITVVFKDDSAYLYDYVKPGEAQVEEMKTLAKNGQGLNSYIGKYVRKNFAAKLR